MANVSYDAEQGGYYGSSSRKKTSFVTKLILKTGLAKTEQGATAVMVGIIIISAIFLWFFWQPEPTPEPTYREDLTPEALRTFSQEELELIPSRNN